MKTSLWMLLLAGLPLLSSGQGTPALATGPAIGTQVPGFQAVDQNGHEQTLASIAGPKGTLLVFFRSADW